MMPMATASMILSRVLPLWLGRNSDAPQLPLELQKFQVLKLALVHYLAFLMLGDGAIYLENLIESV